MAKAKQNGSALAVWDEQLAALAKESSKVQSGIGGVGNFLSIRGGQLSYQGASIPGNSMRAIIVDAILENQWYATDFNPDAPSSPACYAFGRDKNLMAPNPEDVAEPQSATCATCPKAQFGSAERGKGKACGNVERLALITEGDLDNLEDAEVAFLKLPYFSTLEYAAYSKQLNDVHHRPPLAFITEVSVHPDPKSQFRVKFRMAEEITDGEVIKVLLAKHAAVSKTIAFPYPKLDGTAPNGAAGVMVPGGGPRNAPSPFRGKAARSAAPPPVAARVPAKKAVAAAVSAAPVSSTKTSVGVKRAVKAPKF